MTQPFLFPELEHLIIIKSPPSGARFPWPRGMGATTRPSYYTKEDVKDCPRIKDFTQPESEYYGT